MSLLLPPPLPVLLRVFGVPEALCLFDVVAVERGAAESAIAVVRCASSSWQTSNSSGRDPTPDVSASGGECPGGEGEGGGSASLA